MDKIGLVGFFVWLCVVAGVVAVSAEDVTGKSIAEVTLEVPYPTRLYNEAEQFTVRLKNTSESDLIYIPQEAEAIGKQVFINVGRGDVDFEARTRKAPAEYSISTIEDGRWANIEKNIGVARLSPGQTVEWHGFALAGYGNFSLNQGDPRSIQALILIGDGQWVSSKPIPIKQLPQMVNDFSVVFSYTRDKPIFEKLFSVYRGTVEGCDYLFSMGCYRICEVPKGATPKFLYEPETYSVRISFEGVNVPDVIYDQRKRRVLSSEEFNKEYGRKAPESCKPETKEALIAPASISNKIAQVVPPAPSSGVQAKADAKSWNFSYLVAAAFLILLIAALVYRVYTAKMC